MVPHLLQIETRVGYYHMYYSIASLVVGKSSFVEEYVKKKSHDEQFCFTELSFYEYSFSKCNHMPSWNKIQERQRG